tara:strand:- start:357 stop:467 length:111 start_codon:yes stop_codon:yes gene_type:complete
MKKYLYKVANFFDNVLNNFLEKSFQRTEDKLMRKKK